LRTSSIEINPVPETPPQIELDDEPASAIVWQRRHERIQAVIAPAESDEADDPEVVLVKVIAASDAGKIEYHRGMEWLERSPALAHRHLYNAFTWLYTPAIFELDRLFRSTNAKELFLSPPEFARQAESWATQASQLAWLEIEQALLTGTRPVCFQKSYGTPDWENPRWGGGSLFFVQHGEHQFAVTAKHVIDNLDANPDHFRLLLPAQQTLPIVDGHSPPQSAEHYDHETDIFAWEIDQKAELTEDTEWWTWRMDELVKPATDLVSGQRLYAVGFPELEESYDHVNFDINEHPFIASGRLVDNQSVEGFFTIDCDEDLPDVDFNGMSGGPVFARFDDIFHYVGMIVMGCGRVKKLHFIDSRYVLDLFDQIVRRTPTQGG